MPFGLRNAPATFQVLMQRVFDDYTEFVEPYIDDVVVFSSNWVEHLEHLSLVLQRLADHSEYRRPITKKQMRSFIRLCNYYSCFVPQFSSYSSFLNSVLTKTSPNKIVWTQTLTDSFNSIIGSIVNHACLCVPSPSNVYCVACDASSQGVGEALLVCRDDEQLPVCFYSRKLSSAEQKYSATELEALAVFETVRHFRFYLLGRTFTLYSDHKALVHFFTSNWLNNRLWRWQMQLADYDFNIIYRESVKNKLPDALSRQGWQDNTDPQVDGLSSGAELLSLQEGDVVE